MTLKTSGLLNSDHEANQVAIFWGVSQPPHASHVVATTLVLNVSSDVAALHVYRPTNIMSERIEIEILSMQSRWDPARLLRLLL
jgi:hypothetical protein